MFRCLQPIISRRNFYTLHDAIPRPSLSHFGRKRGIPAQSFHAPLHPPPHPPPILHVVEVCSGFFVRTAEIKSTCGLHSWKIRGFFGFAAYSGVISVSWLLFLSHSHPAVALNFFAMQVGVRPLAPHPTPAPTPTPPPSCVWRFVLYNILYTPVLALRMIPLFHVEWLTINVCGDWMDWHRFLGCCVQPVVCGTTDTNPLMTGSLLRKQAVCVASAVLAHDGVGCWMLGASSNHASAMDAAAERKVSF